MTSRRPSDPGTPPADPSAATASRLRPQPVSQLWDAIGTTDGGPESLPDDDVIDASSEDPGEFASPSSMTRGANADASAFSASTARRLGLDTSSPSSPATPRPPPGRQAHAADSDDDDDDGDSAGRRQQPDEGALPVGERGFGPFTLLRRLAFGGMGEVFLARRDTTLSASLGGGAGLARLVVVKRILSHMRRDEKQRRAFVDEARLQTLLRSPNIVQIHDVGEIDGQVYLAMEHVHGPSWRAVIDRCRRRKQHIPLAYLVDMMSQAAQALSYAHNLVDATSGQPLHIVHRDVNPHNILVTFDGDVKVIDFGIAKSDLRDQHTETGTIKGKFAYMSPEQSAAEPLDARSDLFALGICLYELTTLTNPFKRSNVVLSLEAVQKLTPPLPSALRPGAAIVDPIVERMLRKNPDDRFADCAEVAAALHGLLQDGLIPEPAQPLSTWLRELFTLEIALHLRVLEETSSAVDVAVSSSTRLPRPPSSGTGSGPAHPRSTTSTSSARARARPPADDVDIAGPLPPTDAGDDATAVATTAAHDDGSSAGAEAAPGTGPTRALSLSSPSRRAPVAIAAAVALGVASVLVGAWFALREPPPGGVPAAVVDAGTAQAAAVVDAGTAQAAVVDAAAAQAAVVDAGAAQAAVVDAGTAQTAVVDAAAAPAAVVRPPPRDPLPPPRVVAPADPQVARIVVGADGFVVKGPRVLGAKQTTTLVVDDRDAPFKLKLRLRADGASARVAVESDPWGIVRVDQVGRGKTPVADVVVPFGKKTLLSLQAPGGRAMDVTLTLTAAP